MLAPAYAASVHAMQSLPKPLSIHTLNLCDVGLTPECVRPITAAMRLDFAGEGLKSLMVANNTGVCRTNHGLGDEGVAMVAAALPPTLQELLLNGTDCGSRGLVAVASVLPTLRSLKKLTLDDNCSVYGDGDDEEQWDGAWGGRTLGCMGTNVEGKILKRQSLDSR